MDIFNDFLHKYAEGRFSEGLELIIRDPDSCYDTLISTSPHIQQLANYADSLVFGDYKDYALATQKLYDLLKSDQKYNDFVHILANETAIRASQPRIADTMSIEKFPLPFRSLVGQHRTNQQRKTTLSNIHKYLPILVRQELYLNFYAWQFIPFRYPLKSQQISPGEIPMILLEPSQENHFTTYLSPFQDTPALYIFDSYQHFYSVIKDENTFNVLANPQNLIYILGTYPHENFEHPFFRDKTFAPILPRDIPHGKDFFPLLAQTLSKTLSEKNKENASFLYTFSSQWTNYKRSLRLGESRCLAFYEKTLHTRWSDAYNKQIISSPHRLPINMNFTPKDFVAERLQRDQQQRKPRILDSGKKLRVVHMIPFLGDYGVAPATLLHNLLEHTNRSIFDPSVICTDAYIKLTDNYPAKEGWSNSSQKEAPKTIDWMKSHNIDFWISQPALSIETQAVGTIKKLEEWGADIAVFHIPDVVNSTIAASTNTPLRVFMDYGTQPEYPGYDCAILNCEQSANSYGKELQKMNTDVYWLNYALNARKTWQEYARSKEGLGFPSDAFIMTTVSSSLDYRLNDEMCRTIGEILRRCPHAWYAVIGGTRREREIRTLLLPYKVNERVKFMDFQINPGQMIRTFHLYLNEFPIGGCLALIEAMASSLPIVSMYKPNGPQAAQCGGIYYGLDRVIQLQNIEEYINLACNLATNKKMYAEWSEHAKQQYLKHSDEKEYVKKFEKILLEQVEKRKKS